MLTDHPTRRRHRSSESDDQDTPINFCYAILMLFMFLSCLLKMKPRTRIGLMWFYVMSASVLAGVFVYRHYDDISLSVSPTDMRLLDSISMELCSSVYIRAPSNFSVYSLSTQPKISGTFTFSKTMSNNIQYQYFTKWKYFHLSGTIANVYVCGELGLKFVIIKGADNFQDWIETEDCGTCTKHEYYLRQCDTGSQYQHFYVNVAESGDYYYVIINGAIDESTKHVDTEFIMTETRYDVSKGVEVCTNISLCNVELSYESKSVIIEMTEQGDFDSTVHISSTPRAYVYILLFVVFPIILGTLFTYIILRCARKCRSASQNERESDIFTVSNNERGFENPNFRLTLAPPSYREAPPSYEEVMAEQRENNS
ncbi:uncharacterized protein LOC127834045 [Dreissena polymorpha]|uniref:E3 ubiquitin-protein ligase APD1-4 middle domain-containing protein n=1 Tax=Dreissena polymorpha TaxID=45954 RepID=A0A9D4GAX6_DREPO|nr:uncharacterized protein LOC127834045 [Dreissena polymorpha]KAH3813856.1 hypothetical protein DPMN_142326 [Dreissena polymorpha]